MKPHLFSGLEFVGLCFSKLTWGIKLIFCVSAVFICIIFGQMVFADFIEGDFFRFFRLGESYSEVRCFKYRNSSIRSSLLTFYWMMDFCNLVLFNFDRHKLAGDQSVNLHYFMCMVITFWPKSFQSYVQVLSIEIGNFVAVN